MPDRETCPACDGTGRGAEITVVRRGVLTTVYEPCPVCRGLGTVPVLGTLADISEDPPQPTPPPVH